MGRTERYAEIAAEFIRLKVDVIVTFGTAVPPGSIFRDPDGSRRRTRGGPDRSAYPGAALAQAKKRGVRLGNPRLEELQAQARRPTGRRPPASRQRTLRKVVDIWNARSDLFFLPDHPRGDHRWDRHPISSWPSSRGSGWGSRCRATRSRGCFQAACLAARGVGGQEIAGVFTRLRPQGTALDRRSV